MRQIFVNIKKHFIYFIGIILLFIFAIWIVMETPQGEPIPILEDSFFLFGLGMNTTILILSIGLYLIYRWIRGKKRNQSQLSWGICWILYSWTFIAHIIRALGGTWANENNSPANFLLFRFVMIIFAAGMYYGISMILTQNKKKQIYPTIAILGASTVWFLIGLFVINSIETMMYGFLYFIWCPILFTLAYTFFLYGRDAKLRSPYLISLGFLVMSISYLAWAPWHFNDVIYLYFIWYFVFQISLVPILLGYVLLTSETTRPSN
jgi:hypothetical protein